MYTVSVDEDPWGFGPTKVNFRSLDNAKEYCVGLSGGLTLKWTAIPGVSLGIEAIWEYITFDIRPIEFEDDKPLDISDVIG